MRGEDDEDAVELAVELDRLLARRDAETGALATETLEFVGAVSPEFLFGRAKETAPVNESIAAPGSFYACQGAIAMTMECVGAVYRASAEAMRRRRRERESSGGAVFDERDIVRRDEDDVVCEWRSRHGVERTEA
jgi:hypothetical protein